jgi:hypothetical protein
MLPRHDCNRAEWARRTVLLTETAAGAAGASTDWLYDLNATLRIEADGERSDWTLVYTLAARFPMRAHAEVMIDLGQAHADFKAIDEL